MCLCIYSVSPFRLSPDTGVILPSWSVSQLRPAVPCAPAYVSPGVLSCPAHTTHTSAHTAVRSVHPVIVYCHKPGLHLLDTLRNGHIIYMFVVRSLYKMSYPRC